MNGHDTRDAVGCRGPGRRGGAVAALAVLVLGAAGALAEPQTNANVLIVTGRDYPGHKWKETAPVLKAALAADTRLGVTVSEDPAVLRAPELGRYRAIVLHYMIC